MEVESGTSESKILDSTAPDGDRERESKRKKSLESTPDGVQGAGLEMAGDGEGAGAGAGDEIMQTEKVINAIRYYRKYGHAKLRHFVTVFK
ncbi:unnamed protein product [Anisakis simplex]|uniref:HELLS n=1 Tax=Anisakis simplex TaxID=6269 RepID=A0A0M3JQC2_ANISI|nr:unnamed protein product [Anisakis simplex]